MNDSPADTLKLVDVSSAKNESTIDWKPKQNSCTHIIFYKREKYIIKEILIL